MKLIGTKELETKRLILRKLKIDDYKEAYKNWCSSDNVCRFTLWDKHKNDNVTKELFTMWKKEYESPDTFRWIVELKDTHELIGTIDVASKKYIRFGTVELGYCYGENYWHKGYATEALKRVIKFLFDEVEFETLMAEHLDRNPNSGKVMKKAGMSYEGRLRSRVVDRDGIRNDVHSYSITKEEYLKNIDFYKDI